MSLDTVDPTFIADLRDSKTAVDRAAKWLSQKGYPVVVRPTFERPDASKHRDYSDDGDLEIMQRVEVKRRINTSFTCREDFPYPSIIVDVCHAYDEARPKPYSYLIFNREMTCLVIIDCKTRPNWRMVTKADRFRGRDRTFYECPVELVRFEVMEVVA